MHDRKELMEAMAEAEKAFNNHLSDEHSLDPAYFDLKLTGYSLSPHGFEPLTEVTIEPTHEVQDGGEVEEE